MSSVSMIRLIGDRASHPARSCLLLARAAGITHEEVNVGILQGKHMKHPELPMKKVPVMKHGDVTIAESTTILRYLSQQPGNNNVI